MIIPYHTDAPLYHRPIGTISLIVANVAIFGACVSFGFERAIATFALPYDAGLTPLQWFTSSFLHGDVFHLVGNMLFLWCFGLIVEGKIGSVPFLALYLSIGGLQCALEQAALGTSAQGVSFGASSVVYGLMAITVLWAPVNEIECLVVIGIRTFTFSAPVVLFAAFYFVWDIFVFWLTGYVVSTPLLHLSGAVIGAGFGGGLLAAKLVDCENYDLVAVLQGREGRRESKPRTTRREKASSSYAEPIERFRSRLKAGRFELALRLYPRLHSKKELEPTDYRRLFEGLRSTGRWSDSIPIHVDFIHRFPADSAKERLKLAEILLRQEKRPLQALKVLEKVSDRDLPTPLRDRRAKLERWAEKQRQIGTLEAETEDW